MKIKKVLSVAMMLCLFAASGSTLASMVTITQSQVDEVTKAQKENSALLVQILSTLKQNNINAMTHNKSATECVADGLYSQGFVIKQSDNRQLRCDMKDGHPQWVQISPAK